jgi:hypothetical protein
MLLELQDTSIDNINKLMAFARQNNLKLSLVDDNTNNFHLPGKPLSADQLQNLIEKSRRSGIITMQSAHEIIRDNIHAD